LKEFAQLAAAGLPEGPSIALADNSSLLMLVQAYQQQAHPGRPTLFVDTTLLPYSIYQEGLHARAPGLWPKPPSAQGGGGVFSLEFLAMTVSGQALSNQIYYLHPSFGYYFEPLYPVAEGMTYRLLPYATNQALPPNLAASTIDRTLQFWSNAAPSLARVERLAARKVPEARAVGRWYSRALNDWGVRLQRENRLEAARAAFEQAIALYGDNFMAAANLGFNAVLRKAAKSADARTNLDEQLGTKFRTWSLALGNGGPVDDPVLSMALGKVLAEQSLFRQSLREFSRVAEVSTNNVQALFWMAGVYHTVSMPDQVLALLDRVRAVAQVRPLTLDEQLELVRMESLALVRKGEAAKAEQNLLRARGQHPDAAVILDTLVQFYTDAGRLEDAIQLLEGQLQRVPGDKSSRFNLAALAMQSGKYELAAVAVGDLLKAEPANPRALLLESAVLIQLKRYAEAAAPAARVLELEPGNQAARFNHAIALLESGQLDAAERDYQRLAEELPTMHRVHYGLAQIADRRKDRAAAIRHYEVYLRYAPPDSPEAQQVATRLQQLKSGAP
jgi:tetratricopeptide (TPR) repeat protein